MRMKRTHGRINPTGYAAFWRGISRNGSFEQHAPRSARLQWDLAARKLMIVGCAETADAALARIFVNARRRALDS